MIRKPALAALALAAVLAACSSEPEPMPIENDVGIVPVDAAPSPEVTPEAPLPEPSAVGNMTVDVPPPEAPPEPDEQMLDDASATGMTARSSRNQAPPAEAPPVEQTETK